MSILRLDLNVIWGRWRSHSWRLRWHSFYHCLYSWLVMSSLSWTINHRLPIKTNFFMRYLMIYFVYRYSTWLNSIIKLIHIIRQLLIIFLLWIYSMRMRILYFPFQYHGRGCWFWIWRTYIVIPIAHHVHISLRLPVAGHLMLNSTMRSS